MEKAIKFSVQEIDNSGAVKDSDVAEGMTQADATQLAYTLTRRNKHRGIRSWFAVVPYEESQKKEE